MSGLFFCGDPNQTTAESFHCDLHFLQFSFSIPRIDHFPFPQKNLPKEKSNSFMESLAVLHPTVEYHYSTIAKIVYCFIPTTH